MSKPRVMMIGPGRKVMGGISTVVDNYYALGLDHKVKLYYLPSMEDGSKIKKLVVAIRAYITFILLVKKYDIVHIHMAAQASFDRKAIFIEKAKKAGKKIIIHQHAADFDRYYFEQVDEKKRERIKEIFAMADIVIVLSEEWADFFGKNVCDRSKIEVIYNGVIMPDYEKPDYHDHNVLMLGRLGERKGTYDLMKAIPGVLKEINDAVFYLGGDGDIDQCMRIAEQGGFGAHVVFLGWVRNEAKEEQFKKCSTFVLPSYNEGMPMAVLEAMSYGLATISSNAGGIPQIIEQNVNGIRINAGDIEDLKLTLVDVLRDSEKRSILGKNAKLRIKSRFNFEKNMNKLCELYCLLSRNAEDKCNEQ